MSRQKNYVVIEKLCYDKKVGKNQKKIENGYFGLFSSLFHPMAINTHFLGF